MLRTSRILRAKGIQLPEWLDDLWDETVRKSYRAFHNVPDNFYNRGQIVITSPFLQEFMKDTTGAPLANRRPYVETHWVSKERWNEEAKGLAGWTNCVCDIFIVITDEEFNSLAKETDRGYSLFNRYKSTFVHELVHNLESLKEYAKKTDKGKEHSHKPTEWRAYLGEIRGEIQGVDKYSRYFKRLLDNYDPEDGVVAFLNKNSETWRNINKDLPPQGKKYILSAIGRDLINQANQTSTPASYPSFQNWKHVEDVARFARDTLGSHSPEAQVMGSLMDDWNMNFRESKKEMPDEYNSMDDVVGSLNEFFPEAMGDCDPTVQNWFKKNIPYQH